MTDWVNRITGSNHKEDKERLILVAGCQKLQKESISNWTDQIKNGLDSNVVSNGSILNLPANKIISEPMQRPYSSTRGALIEFPGTRTIFRVDKSNLLFVTATLIGQIGQLMLTYSCTRE